MLRGRLPRNRSSSSSARRRKARILLAGLAFGVRRLASPRARSRRRSARRGTWPARPARADGPPRRSLRSRSAARRCSCSVGAPGSEESATTQRRPVQASRARARSLAMCGCRPRRARTRCWPSSKRTSRTSRSRALLRHDLAPLARERDHILEPAQPDGRRRLGAAAGAGCGCALRRRQRRGCRSRRAPETAAARERRAPAGTARLRPSTPAAPRRAWAGRPHRRGAPAPSRPPRRAAAPAPRARPEKDLPGPRQRADRERLGERRAARPFGLGQGRVLRGLRHELEARDEMRERGEVGQDDGRVGPGVVLRAQAREGGRHVAAHRRLEQVDDLRAVGEAEHVAHRRRPRPGPRRGRSPGRAARAQSRTEPSAARAMRGERLGLDFDALRPADGCRCATSRSASTRRRSKRWQRDRIVTGTLRISVVANTNLACGGGSSSVFRKALNAFSDSMWTSSMM